LRFCSDGYRKSLPIDVGIGHGEVQVSRDDARPYGQDDLDQACYARRRFQVSDVGFNRSQYQPLFGGAPHPVDRCCGKHLDRVTQGRSRAVRLQVLHVRRRKSALPESRFDDRLLRPLIGCRQTHTRAVLVDGTPADHCPNRIAITSRVGQALEHHDAAALATHVPVRRSIKRLAAPIGRQHAGSTEGDERLCVQKQIYSACDGHGALTIEQTLAGQVRCHQRRAARGIHRHRGTVPIEVVGNSTCSDRGGIAGRKIQIGIVARPLLAQ
jgi:hypothetical protein